MEENNNQTTAESKKGSTPLIVVGIIVVLAIVGAGFMLTQNKSAPTVNESIDVSGSSSSDQTVTEETTTIEVEGGSFYYKPNEIRVKVGQPVKIVLNSVDMLHDFVVDELNIKSEKAQGGTSTEVTFTPETVGEYEFYCSVGQHRANGMVGKLIVEQ